MRNAAWVGRLIRRYRLAQERHDMVGIIGLRAQLRAAGIVL